MLSVREGGPHRGGSAVANPEPAGPADELVISLKSPEPPRPAGEMLIARHQRPVFVLNRPPQLGGYARGRDRARVPAVRGVGPHLLVSLLVCGGQLRAPLLKYSFAVGRHSLLDCLNERRDTRFGIGRDIDINRYEPLEILVIRLRIEVAGGDADEFCVGFDNRLRGTM